MSDALPTAVDPFATMAAVLERDSGIEFGDEARSTFERRLGRHLLASGFTSYREYASHLQALPVGHPDIQAVLEHLTIKETYFLREAQQVEAFIDEAKRGVEYAVRMGLAPPGSRPELQRLTIWCAGCSTGEEAYSIAILIAESRALDLSKVRIFASDISKKCVEVARRGIYGPSSFRAIPSDIKNRYFVRQGEGELVREIVRGTTRFACANLLDPGKVIGQVDAIFCRNVLIYFSQTARQEAIEIFYEHLVPGGILCLGHSESLLNAHTPFEPVSTPAGILYRKPRMLPAPDAASKAPRGRRP
jgi:chemotaxis protein methyltransferase CheR